MFFGLFMAARSSEHDPVPPVSEISDVDDTSSFPRVPAARFHQHRIVFDELGIERSGVFAGRNYTLHVEVIAITHPAAGDLLHKGRRASGKIIELSDKSLQDQRGD